MFFSYINSYNLLIITISIRFLFNRALTEMVIEI